MSAPRYLYVVGSPFTANGDISPFGEALEQGEFRGLIGLTANANLSSYMTSTALTVKIPVDALQGINPGVGPIACEVRYDASSLCAENALVFRRVLLDCCDKARRAKTDEEYAEAMATERVGRFVNLAASTVKRVLDLSAVGSRVESMAAPRHKVQPEAERMWREREEYLFDDEYELAEYLMFKGFVVHDGELIGLKEALERGLYEGYFVPGSGDEPTLAEVREALTRYWLDDEAADLEHEQEWIMQRGVLRLPPTTEVYVNPNAGLSPKGKEQVQRYIRGLAWLDRTEDGRVRADDPTLTPATDMRAPSSSHGVRPMYDEMGQVWYVKGGDPLMLANEYLAWEVYRRFNVPVSPDVRLFKLNGRIVLASKGIPGEPVQSPDELVEDPMGFTNGFFVDVLLGNWDVVGNYPRYNVIVGPDDIAYRIDTGGFDFRALGSRKPEGAYGRIPTELGTFAGMDGGTPMYGASSAEVFTSMMSGEVEAAARVLQGPGSRDPSAPFDRAIAHVSELGDEDFTSDFVRYVKLVAPTYEARLRYLDNFIHFKEYKQRTRQPNPSGTQSKPLKFRHKEGDGMFRVTVFGGRGFIELVEGLSLEDCKPDVDRLMQSHEYQAAAKAYAESRPPRKRLVRNEATGRYEDVEIGPAVMYPKVYIVYRAFINDPELRGKGYGKALYREAIRKAAEYAGDRGAFIAPLRCSVGSGTSPDARRVWKSLSRDYLSSGDVIFVHQEAGIGTRTVR